MKVKAPDSAVVLRYVGADKGGYVVYGVHR